MTTYSSLSTIGLVMRREAARLLKSKALWTSLFIMVVLIVVGGVVGYVNGSDGDAAGKDPVIAVVGEGGDYPDQSSAEAALIDSADDDDAPRVDAVLVEQPDGAALLYAKELPAGVIEQLNAQRTADFLAERGIAPEDFNARLVTPVHVGDTSSGFMGDPETFGNRLVAMVGVCLLVFAILQFAIMIGSAVLEEKNSRVVEIMLATVRPLDFLWGKVLGVGSVALAMLTILYSIGICALIATGLADTLEFDWFIIPIVVVFFILGFIFFGLIYAAAGSLASRMEDFQSTQMPVLLLAFAMFYVPIFGFTKLDSTFMHIAGWVPPLSIGTAPLQYAAGNFSLLQLCASGALLLVSTVSLGWLAARIYQNSVLRSGSAISWVQALKSVRN